MFTKAIFAGLAAVIVSTAATPTLARGLCKDFYIEAVNNTGKTIKIIDVDYMISGYGMKSEPVRNTDRRAGQIFTMERTLEEANERNTQVIIKYRERTNNKHFNKWTGVKKAKSNYQECKRNKSYRISID